MSKPKLFTRIIIDRFDGNKFAGWKTLELADPENKKLMEAYEFIWEGYPRTSRFRGDCQQLANTADVIEDPQGLLAEQVREIEVTARMLAQAMRKVEGKWAKLSGPARR